MTNIKEVKVVVRFYSWIMAKYFLAVISTFILLATCRVDIILYTSKSFFFHLNCFYNCYIIINSCSSNNTCLTQVLNSLTFSICHPASISRASGFNSIPRRLLIAVFAGCIAQIDCYLFASPVH